MTGGDLRPPAAPRQLLQRIVERKRRLLRVPAAGEQSGHPLPSGDLGPEAREAQRARTFRFGVFVVTETVPRLRFAAGGTHAGTTS